MARRRDYLFSDNDLSCFLEQKKMEMKIEIENLSEDRIINIDESDLLQYMFEKYSFQSLMVNKAGITVDQNEQDIHVNDYGRNLTVKGTLNLFYLPYSGDMKFLKMRPSGFSSCSPRGLVRNDEIVIQIESRGYDHEDIKKKFDRELESIEKYIGWLNRDIEKYNDEVKPIAEKLIKSRLEKVKGNRKLVENLGFPLRKRANGPNTYKVPSVKRRIVPKLLETNSNRFEPEPVLDTENYCHILEVIDNMVLVMERSPSAFKGMTEEDLRQHFLVQLNGHYEGQATGETFNFKGKTDILIRHQGKNLFIGECKFWRGAKSFTDTIDQILDYTSWRDTKTAILVFNRNKDVSGVASQIPTLLKSHSNFIRLEKYDREMGWKCIYHHKDDKQRELFLTVHVYEVPH